MASSEIQNILKNYALNFNYEVIKILPLPIGEEKKTVEAMIYSLTNGGKRIRAFLVSETAKLFGVSEKESFRVAAALEMIHAYSLIHDDLPAMDDDILRRGKPTCHVKFDEATAILAGDGLLTLAFEILSDEKTNKDAEIRCKLISHIANAAGAFDGMIAGQTLDMFSETCTKEQATPELVKNIEKMKTGRLIKFACEAGAILGKSSEKEYNKLTRYAKNIGQAFQIADDILDVSGDEEKVGKTLNKDEKKTTFISIFGLETAKKIAKELVNDAKNNLETFGTKANNLKMLADFIIDREY